MKIFLMADLEGASGVVNFNHQANPDGFLYDEARDYMISDVNAAIEGALEGGADEVFVFDMHFYGLNLDLNQLHPKARLIAGKPRKIYPLCKLDKDFKGLIMIGYHAMAKTEGGLLTHTYDYSMKKLYLNGILMGEIGMEAAIAGCYKVPLIMISGDSKAIQEAEHLLGNLEKAVVKYSINEHSALCLPASVTREIIKEAARRAVQRIGEFKPFLVNPPYRIEVEFFDFKDVEKAEKIPGVKRAGKLTVELNGDDLPALWENFIGAYQGYE